MIYTIQGTEHGRLKTILEASNFSTMNKAVTKYLQCSTEMTGNANSILYTQRGNNYRVNNFRNNYRGRCNNRGNYQYNGYYQNNVYNQNNSYNRKYNNETNNNYSGRGNYRAVVGSGLSCEHREVFCPSSARSRITYMFV